MSSQKKLILVIGATGAQGIAVIDALLAPAEDGSPSPYAVRALTRDPESKRAQSLAVKGVELFEGQHGLYTWRMITDKYSNNCRVIRRLRRGLTRLKGLLRRVCQHR